MVISELLYGGEIPLDSKFRRVESKLQKKDRLQSQPFITRQAHTL